MKKLKLAAQKTKSNFAQVMGVTVDTVRKWEQKGSGIKSGPAIRMLQQIELSDIPTDLIQNGS